MIKRLAYIHCFGRSLQTQMWRNVAVGTDEQFGHVPMALLTLTECLSIQHLIVHSVGFGTGSSTDERGVSEAELIRQEAFGVLRDPTGWPRLMEAGLWDDPRVQQLVYGARIDDRTQKTSEEVEAARDYMLSNGITQFFGVTCPSHLPRCASTLDQAFAGTGIIWSLRPSETRYQDSTPGDAVVFESPHLPNDKLADVKINEIMRQFWTTVDPLSAARQVDALLKSMQKPRPK